MNEKVSVVTVCFNAEKDIERTLKSVLNQSYKNFEYIIKDGLSTDGTLTIIRNYEDKFQERGIRIEIVSEADSGIYDAMNQAVDKCTGTWVIFMNAGDLFYNVDVLSDVFKGKSYDEFGVIYGHTLIEISSNRGVIANYSHKNIKLGNCINHQSLFTRIDYLRKYQFNTKYRIYSDYEHQLKLVDICEFKKVNVIIAVMNKYGISSSDIVTREKELTELVTIYNIGIKPKKILVSKVKQIVKNVLPIIEKVVYLNKYMKKTMNNIK